MAASQVTPRHLLFATDLSARCDRARDRAIWMAKSWKARLTVVHVLDAIDAPNDTASRPGLAGAPRRARQLLHADFQDVDGVDLRFEVRKGQPGEVILEVAAAKGCDLIVTGIATGDAMSKPLLGSAIKTISRGASVPVLVVKKLPKDAYRRVAVASDLSEASKPALETALRLFQGRDVTLIHVYDMPYRMLVDDQEGYADRSRLAAVREARAFLADAGNAATPRIVAVHGDPAFRIGDHAAWNDIDLVIAGTQGRTGLLHALLGSVAAAILDQAPSDVMIVPSRSSRAVDK